MNHPVILFDGICNLCNASVRFIIKHDKNQIFRFSPLQSEYSKVKTDERNLQSSHPESIILIEGEKTYTLSTAVLRIARRMDGIWPAFFVLVIIPRPVRDFFYKVIARNRYRWFGKRNQCMVPEPGYKSRFIE